jgi:hypothetical protein
VDLDTGARGRDPSIERLAPLVSSRGCGRPQDHTPRADAESIGRFACSSLLAALALCAGCAPGANSELRALVEEASLPASSSYDCEWGSSSFDHEPKSWYGCWAYVPGTLESVSRTVRKRLIARRFGVSSENAEMTVELIATRGGRTICVDVLARGFVRGRNTFPSEVDIDAGEVFVDIWTVEPRESSSAASRPQCAELPRWPDQ